MLTITKEMSLWLIKGSFIKDGQTKTDFLDSSPPPHVQHRPFGSVAGSQRPGGVPFWGSGGVTPGFFFQTLYHCRCLFGELVKLKIHC